MDYEKKYKETLEKVKIWQNHLYEVGDKDYADELNYIFSELKESEDERIRKGIKSILERYKESGEVICPYPFVSIDEVLAWLEKQGEQKQELLTKEKALKNSPFVEQKPADKVEPMFHEGDWVVQGCNILKIRCVGDEYYCYETVGGYVDDMLVSEIDSLYHLWTIQDAKDGDVLSDGTTIFIFKDLLSDGSVMSYCDYDTDSGDSDAFCPLSVNLMCSKITPTTKEQRELLFSKMKDARYEWDAKRKKLKKIDARENLTLDGDLMEADCIIAEQKPTWSEEDDRIYYSLLADIRTRQEDSTNTLKAYYNEQIDWLKALKDRYT